MHGANDSVCLDVSPELVLLYTVMVGRPGKKKENMKSEFIDVFMVKLNLKYEIVEQVSFLKSALHELLYVMIMTIYWMEIDWF